MGRDGKGWEGMGRDGKGWEGIGRDGKGWKGMGRDGKDTTLHLNLASYISYLKVIYKRILFKIKFRLNLNHTLHIHT